MANRNALTAASRAALRIDLARLRRDMDDLARIGRDEGGRGMMRPGFSAADMEARRFVAALMEAAGLAASMDAVGNVLGRWDVGDGPAVMAGSHLDTVPHGGTFDGALGVCAAIEAVRAMREAGVTPRHPIEVVATAEEEGRFGGMLGAQALSGQVDEAWLFSAVDARGARLVDAMRAQGLAPERHASAARDPASVKAFLELHVEQGPVLEAAGIPIGIVEAISGVFSWSVTLTGEANHAGTTPMDMRRDAFAGLAAFAGMIADIVAAVGTDQTRVTIGSVAVEPGHPHIVPGRASFSLIGRDVDEAVMRAVAARCRDALASAAARSGLGLEVAERGWLAPKACHREVVEAFRRNAEVLGLATRTMPSGAGHDTQFMADLTKAGMIFVPSAGGISHAPEEYTEWPDVEAGANLLLNAMADLAGGFEAADGQGVETGRPS